MSAKRPLTMSEHPTLCCNHASLLFQHPLQNQWLCCCKGLPGASNTLKLMCRYMEAAAMEKDRAQPVRLVETPSSNKNTLRARLLSREVRGSPCLGAPMGHTPSTAGTFRKKFRKNSGKTPETLSERFLEFPSRVRLGCPKPYNSRHVRLPEHFQNYLPPSTAGDASFFRSGSGEGLPEPVMEFPAVLGAFLIQRFREMCGNV